MENRPTTALWAVLLATACGRTPLPAAVDPVADAPPPPPDLLTWVPIEGGRFVMGAFEAGDRATPEHEVDVASFEMTDSEVTNAQYAACVSAGACTAPHRDDETCHRAGLPGWPTDPVPDAFRAPRVAVTCLDRAEMETFARWAGARLPSEAEWEYAARGGGERFPFPWGEAPLDCERAVGSPCDAQGPAEVCVRPTGQTPQGLCDMAGNVWERVADTFHETYDGAPDDGSAWAGDAGELGVIRGGSFVNDEPLLTVAHRSTSPPDARFDNLGFRLARDARDARDTTITRTTPSR